MIQRNAILIDQCPPYRLEDGGREVYDSDFYLYVPRKKYAS